MALNKTGHIYKFAATATSPQELGVELEIEKVIETKKEGCIYFRARAISAGDQGPAGTKWNYNGNFDYFARKQLEAAFETFNGRNLFLNHDTNSPLKAVGKVLDAYPVEDPETGEFYIECLSRVDKDLHPELARMIENGDLNSVSMGASCEASMCCICTHTIKSDQDDKCRHLASLGQEFQAEKDLPEFGIAAGDYVPAFAINSGLSFSELSIVSVPADSAALIKTVIANFRTRLNKVAALRDHRPNDVRQIVAEFDTVLGLLAPQARVAARQQIHAATPEAYIHKTAAAYDALVYALGLATDGGGEDSALSTGDLFQAMQSAGFSVGRNKDGKPERQIFYTALHRAQAKNWIQQVQTGVYALTEEGQSRYASLKQLLGEGIVPGKGRIKDNIDDAEDWHSLDLPGKEPATDERTDPATDTVAPIWPQDASQNLAVEKEAQTDNSIEGVDSALDKINGVVQAYNRIREYFTNTAEQGDTSSMTVKNSNKKDAADKSAAPTQEKQAMDPMEMAPEMAEESPMEAPMDAAPMEEAPMDDAPESSPAEEADAVSKLEEAKDALETAQAAIEEVMAHETEEVEEATEDADADAADAEDAAESTEEGADDAEFDADEMSDDFAAESSQRPKVTAQFTKKQFLSRSFWTVYANEKPIITATLRDICGNLLPEMKALVTSSEYGDRLVARIKTDGPQKVATLINAKIDKVATDHHWGSDKNQKAHEKGHNEVVKAHETAEREADSSRKSIDRPYGEPGDHLKAQATGQSSQVAKEAAEKQANEGRSPEAQNKSKAYEQGHNQVRKQHESTEKEAESSRKDVDRPYGEPGDHLKAQAAKEEGYSPAPQNHQKDYEKGHNESVSMHEKSEKSMKKHPHIKAETSYEAGEHLEASKDESVAKQAACQGACGNADCADPTCDLAASKEVTTVTADDQCTCEQDPCACEDMEASAAKAVTTEASNDSPDTLTKAEAGDRAEPAGPQKGQDWDSGKGTFASDKVESDETKAKAVGAEAALEKGEQTLTEAEGGEAAHPKADKSNSPIADDQKKKEVGVEADLEKDESSLEEAEKPASADTFKPPMGSESEVPSDEAKKREVGTEASTFADGKTLKIADGVLASKDLDSGDIVLSRAGQEVARYPDVFSSDETRVTSFLQAVFAKEDKAQQLVAQRETELTQEKFEQALKNKMVKCRTLIEDMVRKDLLAIDSALVDKIVKEEGMNLLDARRAALQLTVDAQLASFMQMPDNVLQVQAETIARLKKTSTKSSGKETLGVPPYAQFSHLGKSDEDWMQDLPWS